MTALQGIRIIELAESPAGEYCGKLLADFGAEVVKVERPGKGSPTRAMAPIISGAGGQKASGLFAFLNTNKRSVTIDLSNAEGLAKLNELLASASAIIDDHGADWLAAHNLTAGQLAADHPHAVFTSITPFGLNAPRDLANAQSINVMHASGWGYHTGAQDDPEKPPLKGSGRFLVDYEGAMDAAICTLAALRRQHLEGSGEFIDLSVQSTLVSRADHIAGRMLAGEMAVGTSRGAFVLPGPNYAYKCADGYIHLYVTPVHWPALIELLDMPQWREEFAPDWLFRLTDRELSTFREHFTAWVADQQREALCERAQELGIPLVLMNDAADLLASDQLAARGYFQQLDHPVLGKADYPTAAYRLSATPVRLERPAPSLGQDNSLLSAKFAPPPAKAAAKPGYSQLHQRGGPLSGIRVLAIAKVWAGPFAAKLLSFLGAEVIRVESRNTVDSMRTYLTDDIDNCPVFLAMNPEMLGVQVNMKTAEGLHYLKEMIAQSDMLLENLRPGALERLGLGYNGTRAIRPDIIHVSLKMNGNTGPLAHQTGYAPSFAALSGMHSLCGYEDEPPCGMNQFYGDTTAGAAMAYGALAALMHRERTGEGQFVDVSATEALSSMIGDSLFEYSLTGQVPRHNGNRHPDMAPHGVYPCQDGEWISIAVNGDDVWRCLCDAVQAAALADDTRFVTQAARQARVADLDAELAGITACHDAASLAAFLRSVGVPAHKSCNSRDLIGDRHLWERDSFTAIRETEGKLRPIVGAPWRLSNCPAKIEHGAPAMGQHNDYVYGDLLGLSPSEIRKLIDDGVIE